MKKHSIEKKVSIQSYVSEQDDLTSKKRGWCNQEAAKIIPRISEKNENLQL